MTVVVSVLALWLLARIRFQERPVTADPVPPVLAQLRPQSSFDDLARSIAEMRPAIAASVYALDGGRPALRFREDASVTLAPVEAATRLAFDRPTRLTIVRSSSADVPGLMPWVPRLLDYPRYLVVAEFTAGNLALRPVFVGGLYATQSPLWAGDIWVLPAAAAIEPGTFVFTVEGALAGLAIGHNERTAIVPATHLMKTAEQLLRDANHEPGEMGVSVQPLTPPIASATGASTGVVVTSVDPSDAAAAVLAVTDVIEAVNGQNIVTPEHWRARAERLRAGDTVSLRVRRGGAVRDVQVTAVQMGSSPSRTAPSSPTPPADDASLGMRLRTIPRSGAEVLSVEPSSSAARASIQPGDVITVAGQQINPTPAQITRAFAALPDGGRLLVAFTRGNEHRVVVLEK
jgi:hypothetical protein